MTDLDTNLDGYVDQTAYDTTGEGVADTWHLDTNFDGYFDQSAIDSGGDAIADTWQLDQDQDGLVDSMAFDMDGEGTADHWTELYETVALGDWSQGYAMPGQQLLGVVGGTGYGELTITPAPGYVGGTPSPSLGTVGGGGGPVPPIQQLINQGYGGDFWTQLALHNIIWSESDIIDIWT